MKWKKKKEKKDNKEVKDLVKKAEKVASEDKPKEDPTKVKPETKEVKTKTPPKPEPKPEKDPEKEALKQQVKILTERVGSIEGLLKEAAEAAKTMQQGQEGLTDEQQLEQLQQQQQQGQEQGQGQAQIFGPNQYFLIGKLFDMLGKVVPTAMLKSGSDNSGPAAPAAVLKQVSFWFDAFTKLQSNLLTGLKLLPQPVRDQAFKGAVGLPSEEKGKEEPRHISS